MSQKSWIFLDPLKCPCYAAPRLLNDKYVVLVGDSDKGKIYSCNLEENKWFNIGKLGMEPLRHSIIVDNKTQKIYVYSNTATSTDIFFEIDILHKSSIMYKGIIHGLPQGLDCETGGFVELCQLNNTMHAIGGYSFAYHSIWINGEKQNKINRFIQNKIGDRDKRQSLYGHSLITIKALNQILMFGGRDNTIFGGYLKDIWVCQTTQNIANIIDYKWNKLKNATLPYKMCSFGCIKTFDENYILIFGGKTASGLKDAIWILNTSNWKWTKAAIKCPKKSKYFAVITSTNDIHLFGVDQDKHWKIKLSQILSPINNNNNILNHHSITNSFEEKETLQSNMKIRDDKHYEDTINVLKSTNNKLTQDLVSVRETLQSIKKQHNSNKEWKEKFEKINVLHNALNEKYLHLLEREKYKILNDTSDYKDWSHNDIVDWVKYLDGGRFMKYIHSLDKHLRIEKIKGVFLPDLDKHDIHRLGITQYEDKKIFLKHCQSLLTPAQTQKNWTTNTVFAHIVV